MFKKLLLTTNIWDNGLENGIRLFKSLKNTVSDQNHPNINQMNLKNRIFLLSSTRSIVWCVIWLYSEKNFFWHFLTKGGTLTKKNDQIFFLQKWSNHAPISTVKRGFLKKSKNRDTWKSKRTFFIDNFLWATRW